MSPLETIIKDAKDFILIISPYIRLYNRIKEQLKLQMHNPHIKITVVYGKAVHEVPRVETEDFKFLNAFPNIGSI
ncbi:MAG: hypothetical protein EOO93_06140 [Pedobacter sp.]|nr:MAG: hypothetical protein EOO93_06140 [Pedobacter sp.]